MIEPGIQLRANRPQNVNRLSITKIFPEIKWPIVPPIKIVPNGSKRAATSTYFGNLFRRK